MVRTYMDMDDIDIIIIIIIIIIIYYVRAAERKYERLRSGNGFLLSGSRYVKRTHG